MVGGTTPGIAMFGSTILVGTILVGTILVGAMLGGAMFGGDPASAGDDSRVAYAYAYVVSLAHQASITVPADGRPCAGTPRGWTSTLSMRAGIVANATSSPT